MSDKKPKPPEVEEPWMIELRKALQEGREPDVPHDPAWWEAWSKKIKEAPIWEGDLL